MDNPLSIAEATSESETMNMPKRANKELRLIPFGIKDQALTEEEDWDREPQVVRIQTEADFISFVIDLRDDYLEHPEDWQNPDLESFLDALATCAGDILVDDFTRDANRANRSAPTWKRFAEILQAAKYYPEMDGE